MCGISCLFVHTYNKLRIGTHSYSEEIMAKILGYLLHLSYIFVYLRKIDMLHVG